MVVERISVVNHFEEILACIYLD